MKVLEFLYFYLMPEVPLAFNNPVGGAPSTAIGLLARSPSKKTSAYVGGRSVHYNARAANGGGGEDGDCGTKTTEEKQAFLGRYLSNVEDLVEDLRESAPFGAALN